MKRLILALALPLALNACAYIHGSHHVELEKNQSVLVDHNDKVAADSSMLKAVEICHLYGKKPVLSSTTPGSRPEGRRPILQADFYRCV
ncbi:MAG TPA: hypothetical protein VH105_00125 [Burkholderiales bacterium]|jgi:hypothetical protein|nr:hypothetical protein [Burkholderiales bacterium]